MQVRTTIKSAKPVKSSYFRKKLREASKGTWHNQGVNFSDRVVSLVSCGEISEIMGEYIKGFTSSDLSFLADL